MRKKIQLVTKLKKSSELNKRAQAGFWDRNKRSGNGRSKAEIEKRVTASPIALFQILYRAPPPFPFSGILIVFTFLTDFPLRKHLTSRYCVRYHTE